MNNFIPNEKTVTIPIGMDCRTEGVSNPYERKSYTILDQVIMDTLTSGVGIARIDPADFYKEHLSRDADNE